MMVLTTSAAMILEEEREVLPRPVDTLRANGEVGHSSRLKGKERGRETRPLDESHAKSPTREGGVSMENWAKKGVSWELEVFEEEVGEVPVRKARGKTTNTDPSGRTPQDGVDTNIRHAKNSSNARGSRGEDREYGGRVGDRGLTQGVTNPNGPRKVLEIQLEGAQLIHKSTIQPMNHHSTVLGK
jgi:hypothetical protein